VHQLVIKEGSPSAIPPSAAFYKRLPSLFLTQFLIFITSRSQSRLLNSGISPSLTLTRKTSCTVLPKHSHSAEITNVVRRLRPLSALFTDFVPTPAVDHYISIHFVCFFSCAVRICEWKSDICQTDCPSAG